jgi:hypothetical protein
MDFSWSPTWPALVHEFRNGREIYFADRTHFLPLEIPERVAALSAGGTHTLTIKADSTNVIAESNEQDNTYTKTITVVRAGGGPTPAPSPGCVGDCNHDRSVTVDEILTMVNIALGNADVSACPVGNDGDRVGRR